MAKTKRTTDIHDPVELQLDAIKRLLILFLMKSGTSQGEIAKALGVGQATVSRMMPAKHITPFDKAS